MPDTVEIKTKVTVDDAASKNVLNGLKSQFESLHQVREATQHGMGFFGHTVSMLAAQELPAAISRVKEFAMSFVELADEKEATVRSMTGMISVLHQTPWGEARKEANQYTEQLEHLAETSGKSVADIKAAAQAQLELGMGGKGDLDLKIQQLSQIVTIAKVLGKSPEGLTREFQFMGEGILRTRGQLFQLLSTTGIFGTHARKAAAGRAQLTDEKRTELLAHGIEVLSSKMEKATPTFGGMMQKVRTELELAKEEIGEPLRAALLPELQSLVTWMARERHELVEYAVGAKDKIAGAMHAVGTELRDMWRWIRSHEEEIGAGIKEAWGFAKSVVEFIVRHKEAIAMIAVAKAVGGNEMIRGAAGAGFGVGKAVYNAGSAAALAASPAAGAIGGAAGGIVALGALSVAIVGVGLAADQARKLLNENNDNTTEDERARYEMMKSFADDTTKDFGDWSRQMQDHFGDVASAFVEMSGSVGLSKKVAQDMVDGINQQHAANRKLVESAEYAAAAITDLSARGPIEMKEQAALVASITDQYKAAADASNQGAMSYIANLLTQSKTLQDAFLKSADMTAEGYQSLAELTKASASDFSDALKQLGDAAHKRETTASKVPSVQFNGGQQFKIQQDFRDENPDRIAVIFQRDILAAAERRYQSSYASPFGS